MELKQWDFHSERRFQDLQAQQPLRGQFRFALACLSWRLFLLDAGLAFPLDSNLYWLLAELEFLS